jgi:hypothetical protein
LGEENEINRSLLRLFLNHIAFDLRESEKAIERSQIAKHNSHYVLHITIARFFIYMNGYERSEVRDGPNRRAQFRQFQLCSSLSLSSIISERFKGVNGTDSDMILHNSNGDSNTLKI